MLVEGDGEGGGTMNGCFAWVELACCDTGGGIGDDVLESGFDDVAMPRCSRLSSYSLSMFIKRLSLL